MTDRDVVVVVHPAAPPGTRGTPQRTILLADEFAAAVGAMLRSPVTVVEGTLADVAGAGVILSFLPIREDTLRAAAGIAPRTLWLDVDRSPGRAIQNFGLAGAASTMRYIEWSRHRGRDRAHHVWTRRDLAERLGATVDRLYDGNPDVVQIADPRYANMASLVAALCAIILGDPPPPGDAAI